MKSFGVFFSAILLFGIISCLSNAEPLPPVNGEYVCEEPGRVGRPCDEIGVGPDACQSNDDCTVEGEKCCPGSCYSECRPVHFLT
ncbi:hypothetical protein Avbf_08890 [Armadillidium vulgare]|nr:hypothetical protein Avbf_08890 [Armadillidium vulgare]